MLTNRRARAALCCWVPSRAVIEIARAIAARERAGRAVIQEVHRQDSLRFTLVRFLHRAERARFF